MNTESNEGLSEKEQLKQRLAKIEESEKKEALAKTKAFEKEKEDFVQATVFEFMDLQIKLQDLKKKRIQKGNELWFEMFQLQGLEPREQKKFTFTSKDKSKKVVVERAERMGFSEEAMVGIQGIQEFFKKKFASRSKQIYNLLDALLIKNSSGDYDPKLIAKLRSQVNEINDPELTSHFKIVEENQVAVGSALYLRAYKIDGSGKMKDISIQFSSL